MRRKPEELPAKASDTARQKLAERDQKIGESPKKDGQAVAAEASQGRSVTRGKSQTKKQAKGKKPESKKAAPMTWVVDKVEANTATVHPKAGGSAFSVPLTMFPKGVQIGNNVALSSAGTFKLADIMEKVQKRARA